MEEPVMEELPRVQRPMVASQQLIDWLFPNMAEEEDDSSTNDESQKQKGNKTHAVKKRSPLKPIEGVNVIFVTRKTNFKAQLDKCSELLAKGEKEIIIHGLGAAIQRSCNLAIQLQLAFSGTHEIEINTGTIDVVDDLVPLFDDVDFNIQYRFQSSVHIRIFKTAMTGATQ